MVGDTFPDYNIVMNLAGLKTTSNVTGQKIVAEETLEIDGRSIECVVVEQTTSTKVLGMNQSGNRRPGTAKATEA